MPVVGHPPAVRNAQEVRALDVRSKAEAEDPADEHRSCVSLDTRYLKPWQWCGKRKAEATRQFWALKGPWYRIQRGQLFCLLVRP